MKLSIESINHILGCVCIALSLYLFFVAIKTYFMFYCTRVPTSLNNIVPILASILMGIGILVITFSMKSKKR